MKNSSIIARFTSLTEGEDQENEFWMFALLAGCFMLAVPVTISGTIIVRLVATYTQLYKLFWRYFGVLAAPTVILSYGLSRHASERDAFIAYLIVNNLYFSIVTYQGYNHALRNPQNTRKWLSFGLIALVCCIIDNTVHWKYSEIPFKSHAIMAFPWAFLLMHWRSKLQPRQPIQNTRPTKWVE